MDKEIQEDLVMFKRYVDDVNMAWKIMRRGTRWNGERMKWREEWKREDDEKNEADDKRMMREVRLMANTLESDIQFTVDVASENVEGKLPVLDVKMWVEKREGKNEIMHEFRNLQLHCVPFRAHLAIMAI